MQGFVIGVIALTGLNLLVQGFWTEAAAVIERAGPRYTNTTTASDDAADAWRAGRGSASPQARLAHGAAIAALADR